jgi:hypothetical protein
VLPDSDTPMYDVRRTGPDSTRSSLVGLAWACVGGVPTGLVPPAGSVTVQARLGGTTSSSATPTTEPEAGLGHFRVVLALCAEAVNDSDLCTPLPMPESQSNAFEVRWGGP